MKKRPMSYICNITDLSQRGVVLPKHVISGPFGLFYMPHNFPIRQCFSIPVLGTPMDIYLTCLPYLTHAD